MSGNRSTGIGWKRLLAQALLLSISIYTPFFLENWYAKKQLQDLNSSYKEFLKEDLYTDLDNLDIMIARNEFYSDSSLSIMSGVPDSNELKRRSRITLTLGITTEFNSVTDVETYIDQLRQTGQQDELKLIRRLNELKNGLDLIDVVDARRMDYVQEYYTPIYLNNYAMRSDGFSATNLNYFMSDQYMNIIGMFYSLSIQSQNLYRNTRSIILTCLRVLGEDVESLEPEVQEKQTNTH